MSLQKQNDPNYLLQINTFHRWLAVHYLPANAILLWFMLIDLCNACGWEPWIQVDTQRILHWIGAQDVKTAYRARDALVRSGLLEYEKGHKGHPNRYRLIFFPVKDRKEYETEQKAQDGTQCGTQNGTQCGTQNGAQDGQNAGHINKQNINKTKQNDREYLSSAQADANPRERCDYAKIIESFNRICTALPKVQTLNDRRKQAMRTANPAVETFGGWDKLFGTVQQSDFLTGRSGTWNGCGFDWILKPANLVKILEGNYTDAAKRKETNHDSTNSTGTYF